VVSVEVKKSDQSFAAEGQGRDGVDAVHRALVTALGEREAEQVDGER
jgi:hypothetical protein